MLFFPCFLIPFQLCAVAGIVALETTPMSPIEWSTRVVITPESVSFPVSSFLVLIFLFSRPHGSAPRLGVRGVFLRADRAAPGPYEPARPVDQGGSGPPPSDVVPPGAAWARDHRPELPRLVLI